MAFKDHDRMIQYNNSYNKVKYDRLNVMVLSWVKDIIKAYAATQNESINGFINRLIKEALESEGWKYDEK